MYMICFIGVSRSCVVCGDGGDGGGGEGEGRA